MNTWQAPRITATVSVTEIRLINSIERERFKLSGDLYHNTASSRELQGDG